MKIEALVAFAAFSASGTVATVATAAVDLPGIAIIIGALATAIPLVGGFVLSVLNHRRTTRLQEKQEALAEMAIEQAKHLAEVKTLVNGASEEIKMLSKKAAFAEGEKAGVEAERAQPMIPASSTQDAAQPVTIEEVKPAAVAAITAVVTKEITPPTKQD